MANFFHCCLLNVQPSRIIAGHKLKEVFPLFVIGVIMSFVGTDAGSDDRNPLSIRYRIPKSRAANTDQQLSVDVDFRAILRVY